ncbi:MAG: glycosyltransferase family 2 protein [Pseudomonas sp.]|nr:glycosyltransferase family 2 protein [Pseudomonas sp.]
MKADSIPITGLVLHFRTVERTLACLRSQQQEGIRKAIIVDNSEDGGKSIGDMQKGLDALRTGGFYTEVLCLRRNLGFAGGVACGLKHVSVMQPSHVLLINSDARLETGSLELMRQVLVNAPIVAPTIAQGDQPPSSPFAYYDRLLGLITPTPKITPLHHASGCCLLIRCDQVQCSIFDQDFFFYGEDVMLGFDTQRCGNPVKECPGATVSHATSSSAQNGSIFYEYHINRAHWLLAQKLARSPLEQCLFIGARCITLPLRALVRSFRFRSFLAWKGLLAATCDVLRGRCRSFTPPAS